VMRNLKTHLDIFSLVIPTKVGIQRVDKTGFLLPQE
jgi:hypothetical protein